MTRYGLAIPFSNPMPLTDQLKLAREAEARGYHTAWINEVSGSDAVTTMALLATHTERLSIVSGIIPVQTRTPVVLGMTAASLGSLAPGRIGLGLGVSSRIIIGQWHGLPFEKPLGRLREAVAIIRRVVAGERVSFEGTFYRLKNFRLTIPPPSGPIPIYLAALGPRMLELAGEIADGVVLNFIPPEAIPNSIERLEIGARRAGRSLDGFEIAGFIRVAVTDDGEAARQWLARELAGYSTVDAYIRFFTECGFADEVEAVNRCWQAGDRAGAVRAISPRFLDGMGIVGPADLCRQRIKDFANAGLTQPVVFPFTPDPQPLPSLLRTVEAFPG
jgi:probable F420-dependent oxidoreductase